MLAEEKTVADLVLRLIDTVIKLSTALLVVPAAFLKFVSEIGPKAHPDAVIGVHLIGNLLKLGILVPFGLSIGAGLLAHYAVVSAVCDGTLTQGTKLPRGIKCWIRASGVFFIIGILFLIYLFFQFPIEILEPFQLGSSRLG
ncbi:MAG: hypothetical protein ACYCY3_10815 [Halothiobacillus sp.]